MALLGFYEDPTLRLARLRSALDTTAQSMGDTVTKAVDLEARRRAMEDSLRRFREVEREQMAERRQRQEILDFREQQPPGLERLLSNVIRTGAQTAGFNLLGQELALPENLGGVTPPTVNLPPRQRDPGFFDKVLGVAGKVGEAVQFVTDPAAVLGRAATSFERPSIGGPSPDELRREALFNVQAQTVLPPSFTEIQEEGALVSRPLARAALRGTAEVVEQIEKPLGVEGVVSDKLRSQIAEDIATEILNPINIALVAPFAMQGTAGLTGIRLAEQIASNLLLTGLEPGLIRGTLRGLTLLGTRGTAALKNIPKAIQETPIIQQALRNAREFPEAGARPLRGGEEVAGIENLAFHETSSSVASTAVNEGKFSSVGPMGVRFDVATSRELALGQRGKGAKVILDFDALDARPIQKPGTPLAGQQEFTVFSQRGRPVLAADFDPNQLDKFTEGFINDLRRFEPARIRDLPDGSIRVFAKGRSPTAPLRGGQEVGARLDEVGGLRLPARYGAVKTAPGARVQVGEIAVDLTITPESIGITIGRGQEGLAASAGELARRRLGQTELGSIRGVGELILDLQKYNPGLSIRARPSNERLGQIYARFGFTPVDGAPGVLELTAPEAMEQLLRRPTTALPAPLRGGEGVPQARPGESAVDAIRRSRNYDALTPDELAAEELRILRQKPTGNEAIRRQQMEILAVRDAGRDAVAPLRGGEGVPPRKPPDSPSGLGPPSEPDPPRLPTIREVEARSAKPPPEVRAELAGDVADTAIPLEDFGTVQARWGERFQKNIVTKIEDMLAGRIPGIAKPTAEGRAVRRAMVQADLYRVTQKARARSAIYEWAGRFRETLGLDGNGKVKAIQVAEGADIPGGRKFFGLFDDSLTQRLDHVVEHPEKYIISPEQQRALDDLDDILEQTLRLEQREGVDVAEIAGDYFPRVLVKKPGDDPTGIKLAGRLGTRPGHAKSRFFGDIEEAWKLGYRYDTPMAALFNRLESAADAIANVNAVRVVKSLGQKPSARIPQELVDAARAAREEFKAARKLASRRGATKADKLRLQEAEVALDNHKRALRIAAQQARDIQPKVFGRIVSPEVAQEFSRYIGNVQEGPFGEVMQMARANMIWGDHSAGLVQFWTLFWRDNPTWWKAMGHGIIANLREPWAFVASNADVVSRGVSVGAITPPTEFLLRSGGKFSRAFGKLPLVKQTQRMFEWTIFTGQTMRWKAMERIAKNADDLMELAAVNRATSGTAITPGLTRTQAKALGRTFFAGRFLIATISVFKNTFKGGAAGREARKVLGLAFGGAFTTMVGGHMTLNNGKLPNLTDPDKAGFFSMRVGDVWIKPFGPFHPFIVATFRTSRAMKDIAEGKTPNSRDLQAWPRFLEGKASLGVRINIQILDALGIPLSQIRGEPFQRLKLATGEDWLRQIQEYLPIGPAGAVEALTRKGLRGGVGLLEILGGSTTVVSPFTDLTEGFKEEFGREFNPQSSADWTLARQNPVTAPLVEAQSARSLERGTEGALRAEETEQKQALIEQNLELPRDAAEFTAGNLKLGDELIEKFRDLQTQMAGVLLEVDREEGEAATEDDRILSEIQKLNPSATKYRDSETGDTDWGAFFTDVEELKVQLTPEVRQAYEDILRGVNEDWRLVEPQVKRAIALQRDLFEIPKYLDPDKSDAEMLEYESRLKEFMNFVREELDRAKREFGPDFSLTLPEAARVLGKRDFNDEQLGADAANIFSQKVTLNPARETFLDEHQEELVPFFPNLYRRKRYQELLSDELFEVAIAR